MKRHTILFAIALCFSVLLFASNDNKSRKVAVTNYTEVLSNIEYPTVCREQAIEGTVLVTINVSKKGNIQGYEFIESPCSDLKNAVEKVIPSLTFQPALVDGKAISSKITIPVKFELEY
jgi:protein TonB